MCCHIISPAVLRVEHVRPEPAVGTQREERRRQRREDEEHEDEVVGTVQVKIGIRNIVMPRARMRRIVVMKLTGQDGAEPGEGQPDPQVTAQAEAVAVVGQRRVGEPAECRCATPGVRKPAPAISPPKVK